MANPFIKVSALKNGDTFKINPRHKREHWVQQIVNITKEITGISSHIGKILIVTGECRQYILDPEQEIFLVFSPMTSKK